VLRRGGGHYASARDPLLRFFPAFPAAGAKSDAAWPPRRQRQQPLGLGRSATEAASATTAINGGQRRREAESQRQLRRFAASAGATPATAATAHFGIHSGRAAGTSSSRGLSPPSAAARSGPVEAGHRGAGAGVVGQHGVPAGLPVLHPAANRPRRLPSLQQSTSQVRVCACLLAAVMIVPSAIRRSRNGKGQQQQQGGGLNLHPQHLNQAAQEQMRQLKKQASDVTLYGVS